MRHLYNRIRWAIQRVKRGWDDTALWGLDCHFEETVIPPLKMFCEQWLEQENEIHRLNPERTRVYKETLSLIKKYEDQSYEDMLNGTNVKGIAKYFSENIGYYWD